MAGAMEENTVAVLKDIAGVFQDESDIDKIKELYKRQEDYGIYMIEEEEEAKNLIKELTTRVRTAEKNANHREPSEKFEKQFKQLDEQRQVLKQKQAITLQQIEKLENKKAEYKEKERALYEKEQTVNDNEWKQIPATQKTVSLYFSISKINWDYESKHIRGHISMPHNVTSFNIDPTKHSPYFIANTLWDKLESV